MMGFNWGLGWGLRWWLGMGVRMAVLMFSLPTETLFIDYRRLLECSGRGYNRVRIGVQMGL